MLVSSTHVGARRPEASGGLVVSGVNVIQVRRAVVDDWTNTLLATVDGADGETLRLVGLDGTKVTVRLVDSASLVAVLAESSATLFRGRRLAFVNERCRLLGLAYGPPTPPSKLEIVAVLDLANSSIPPGDEQPGWRLLPLATPSGPDS